MPLYRCINETCETNPTFMADVPVCPDCKADARLHHALVIELVPIHYLAIDPTGPIRTGIGNRRIPCAPARAKLMKSCSGERSVVTCPKCRDSAVFKAHEDGEVDQHTKFAEKKIEAENGIKVDRPE